MGLILTSSSSIYADSIDVSNSSLSLNTLRNFASGLVQSFNDMTNDNQKINLKNSKDQLMVLSFGFNNLQTSGATSALATADLEGLNSDVLPEVIGKALCYPNPFRQSTAHGAQLGYRLSKDMNLEIHVYNMLAQLVAKQTFRSGAIGARQGYNKIQINHLTWSNNDSTGHLLSAGIYFYVLVHEGKVLSKGKMAVKP